MRERCFLWLLFLAVGLSAAETGTPVVKVDGQATTSSVVRGDRAVISISTSFAGGAIFYTLDGTEPSGASVRFTSEFTITETKVLRAIAYSVDFSQSALFGPIEIQIQPTFTLSATTAGGGGVSVAPPANGNRYLSNTVVSLSATPIANWKFVRWTGDASGTENPLSFTVKTNANVRAVFAGKVELLSASHGAIHMGPYAQTEDIPYGTPVRLAPIPEDGYYLAAWGADGSGAANPLGFTLTSGAPRYSALFLPLPEGKASVSVYADGLGGIARVDRRMTVFSPATGFSALAPTNTYAEGEIMLAIAEPSPGWAFVGWSGDASGNENPLLVKAEGTKVIQANFAEGASITLNAEGGEVATEPAGPVFPLGSTVTLRANPAAGRTFDAFFIGNAKMTDNPLTLTLTSNVVVTARFNGDERVPLWEHGFAGTYYGVIAADDAGNTFFGEGSRTVSLSNQGSARWSFDMPLEPDFSASMLAQDLAVTSTGSVFLLAGRGVLRDSPHSFVRLSRDGIYSGGRTLGEGTILGSMALDGAGVVYVEAASTGLGVYAPFIRAILPNDQNGDGNYIAIDTGGSTRSVTLTRPAIDLANNRYFTGRGFSNVVYRSSPSGAIEWAREIDGPTSPAVVLGSDTVYAVGGTGRLWAFSFDGTIKWSAIAADPLRAPSIGADGTLYMGATNSARFYAFNPNGTVKWVRTPGRGNYKAAAAGADGTVYVTDTDSLYALNAQGDLLWQYRGNVSSPAIISSNIVFATGGSKLVALRANAVGLAASPWPMWDATPQQTAAMRPVVLVEAPSIDVPASFMAADGFHLKIIAASGANVTVLGSANLQEWVEIQTLTAVNGEVNFVQTNPPEHRFYRAVIR